MIKKIPDYKINVKNFVVNDGALERKNSIRFHIKSDDYFATLATIVDLIAQDSANKEKKYKYSHDKIFKNIKNDLLYLQKNYKIIKKN